MSTDASGGSTEIDPVIIEKYKRMGEIQRLLDAVLSEINENAERIYEPYIVTSEKFQSAVIKARQSLGIERLHNLGDEHINDWVERNIKPVAIPKYPHITSAEELSTRRFWTTIDSARKDANLPQTWRTYLAIFVITDAPPKLSDISSKRKLIEVKGIDTDTITIRIAKGIRYEEYTKSWTALSEFLGKGRRKTMLPDEQVRLRDLEMYNKHQQGSTQRELAEEYFTTDIEYSKDAVKKALKRQKKLFNKGTDLAQ